jgi:DNA (cytosine-5)-methyltransferase 1
MLRSGPFALVQVPPAGTESSYDADVEECSVCARDARFVRSARRPDYESRSPQIRIVDLFAGGGGLSLGLAEAARRVGYGTAVVAAVERDPDAADVYALNFPEANLLRRDIVDVFDGAVGRAPTRRESELRAQVGRIDVLLAGPPCQGHSDLNNHSRRRDPRNGLYVRVARAAEVLRPRAVLIENVPAVQNDVGTAVPKATAALEIAGYRVATAVLDLVKFGVPQTRRRHLLLALRDGRIDPSAILARKIACERHDPRTVEWAIGDLAQMTSATGPDVSSVPTPENAARMRWLIDNDEYDLPNEMRPACHHGAHSYVSMYGRLRWDAPAQTITTGYGSMGQGRYVHPAEPRTITPHEAARFQTLPDFFDLGADKHRRTWAHVVGNAVPPLLGVHIGVPLLRALVKNPNKKERQSAPSISSPANASISVPVRRRPGNPTASTEAIRQRMANTKRRDTKPEMLLRSELHRRGLRYVVDRPVDGTRRRADIVFRGPRVAVYVDGCYWHGCPLHGTTPKRNRSWWTEKLEANRSRDAHTDARLRNAGWVVLRFWEHDDPVAAASLVVAAVRRELHATMAGRGTPGR